MQYTSACCNSVNICGAVAAAGPWFTGIKMDALQTGMYTPSIHTHIYYILRFVCTLHLFITLSFSVSPNRFERQYVSLYVAMSSAWSWGAVCLHWSVRFAQNTSVFWGTNNSDPLEAFYWCNWLMINKLEPEPCLSVLKHHGNLFVHPKNVPKYLSKNTTNLVNETKVTQMLLRPHWNKKTFR